MSNNTDSISTQKVLQCVRFPPRGFSLGIFGKDNNPWTYSVPTIQSQILLIYVITQLFHIPLKRLGFPKITSEIFVCNLALFYLFFILHAFLVMCIFQFNAFHVFL